MRLDPEGRSDIDADRIKVESYTYWLELYSLIQFFRINTREIENIK